MEKHASEDKREQILRIGDKETERVKKAGVGGENWDSWNIMVKKTGVWGEELGQLGYHGLTKGQLGQVCLAIEKTSAEHHDVWPRE